MVALGTFEKLTGQHLGREVGMPGHEGDVVDVWQFRVTTLYKGDPGPVVDVTRYPDYVNAGQYHMTPGVQAVVFLSTRPQYDVYTTICGDTGLLLVGEDGNTLKTMGAHVPGIETVEQVAALFE